jgi:hypothetical protein
MTGQLNIQHQFRFIQTSLDSLYRINVHLCLLRSTTQEFVYGDGVFSSLRMVCPVTGDELMPLVAGKALVPLTPEMCLFLNSTSVDIFGPNIHSVYLRKSEVSAVNRVTQAMSADLLFSRDPTTHVYDEFSSRRHGPPEERHLRFISNLCTITP